MRKRKEEFTEVMQETADIVSETVSDKTMLYDAAALNNDGYAGDLPYEDASDVYTEQESASEGYIGQDEVYGVLPSDLNESEEPVKKANPIVRFFRWIKSWKMWVKILSLVLILALMTGGVMAASVYKEVEEAVKVMNAGTEIPDDYDLGIQPIDGFINILLLLSFLVMTAGLYITFFMAPVIVTVDEEGYTVLGSKPEGMRYELKQIVRSRKENIHA